MASQRALGHGGCSVPVSTPHISAMSWQPSLHLYYLSLAHLLTLKSIEDFRDRHRHSAGSRAGLWGCRFGQEAISALEHWRPRQHMPTVVVNVSVDIWRLRGRGSPALAGSWKREGPWTRGFHVGVTAPQGRDSGEKSDPLMTPRDTGKTWDFALRATDSSRRH